jgi:glycosyltransferase involved in cell wall biosynthesis
VHKKLSILILTVVGRESMLNELLNVINSQKKDDIEILIENDNGKMKLGRKRNNLIDRAIGDYIVFVDDDDMVPDYYVSEILKGIESQPDCCSLEGVVTFDGINPKIFKHSIKYPGWYEENNIYYRCPNHWNVVKRGIANQVRFNDNISFGEDRDYSMRLRPHLKTESLIDKPMYFFRYRNIHKEYSDHI